MKVKISQEELHEKWKQKMGQWLPMMKGESLERSSIVYDVIGSSACRPHVEVNLLV